MNAKWMAYLSILPIVLTLLGVSLLFGLTIDSFSSKILSLYPRYNLAMEAITILEGEPKPIMINNELQKDKKGKEVIATTLGIDHPSWPVMFDFIRSETAFRKSIRNEPIQENIAMDEESSVNPNTTQKDVDPEINFDRIKSISIIRVRGVPKVGGKSLTEPYRTIVMWPPLKFRRVYDFLSFEEFKLDIKKMLVDELESLARLISVIAAVCTLLLFIAKWLIQKRPRKSNHLQSNQIEVTE